MTQTSKRTRRRKRNPGWHPGLGVSTIREERGLDQKELAVLLVAASKESWDQSKVSRLETGELKMTAARLKAVATVQGMPYEWYMDGPSKTNRPMGLQRSWPVPAMAGSVALIAS
jgi:transcriptional regulator with XRE-family HTH domain